MLRRTTTAACMLILTLSASAAQSTDPAATAPPAGTSPVNTSTTSDQSESMEQPLVGDHWTYELRDEITGALKFTTTNVVTDVTPNEVSVRMENLGNPGAGFFIYDRLWNVKSNPTWKFTPTDGTGIFLPLKTGSTWKIQSNDLYAARGISWKRSGTSKVVGEENITIKAGSFNTFKIETSITIRNANDPTKKSNLTMTTWYAPSINHWIKRTSKTTSDGHVSEHNTTELVEYGRR